MSEEEHVERRLMAHEPATMVAEGIVAIIIGALLLAWPGHTAVTLMIIIGVISVVGGICTLVASIGAQGLMRGALVGWGLVGIILGCVVLIWPIITTEVVLWLIILWLVLYGIYRILRGIWQLPEDHSKRWLNILLGLISVVIGVAVFSIPSVSEELRVMCLLLGIYGVITGLVLICLAGAEWSKRKYMGKEEA